MKITFTVLIVVMSSSLLLAQQTHCEELIIKYEDHEEEHIGKWLLTLANEDKTSLIYFGAIHSKDPFHKQFDEIETIWDSETFDIALFEGPDRGILETKEKTIESLGESGYVRFLANKDSVLTLSLEPNPIEEIDYLSKHFSLEKIKLFYLLREAQRVRESFDWGETDIINHIEMILAKANMIPSLKDTVLTIQDIEDSFTKYWGSKIKWWEAPSYWFDPLQNSESTGGIFTNDVNKYSSHFRNVHMYNLISRLLKQNKKIFAVVGRNHIPMQAKALNCEWEKLKHATY